MKVRVLYEHCGTRAVRPALDVETAKEGVELNQPS